MSPKGQHTKSKARIANYEKLASEEGAQREQELEIYIPAGPRLGDIVAELKGVSKAYGDKVLFEDLSFEIPRAGHPGRHRRQRCGQDHAAAPAHGPGAAGRRQPPPGRDREDGLRGPAALQPQHRQERLRGGLGRLRAHRTGRPGDQRPGLALPLRLHGRQPAEEGEGALRGPAEPPEPGPHPEERSQPALLRRAHQRPGREHHARPGGGHRVLRRQRRHREPRPLVPGSPRHPHPGLRGRQPGESTSMATTPSTSSTARTCWA